MEIMLKTLHSKTVLSHFSMYDLLSHFGIIECTLKLACVVTGDQSRRRVRHPLLAAERPRGVSLHGARRGWEFPLAAAAQAGAAAVLPTRGRRPSGSGSRQMLHGQTLSSPHGPPRGRQRASGDPGGQGPPRTRLPRRRQGFIFGHAPLLRLFRHTRGS